MELATAIKHAIDGNAVLFLGSGFSVGAKPITGDTFLTGRELSVLLSRECGMNPPSEDLNFSAQRYRKKFSDSTIVSLLQGLYSASSVSEAHRRFSEVPWRSIYTTNYDNVLERAFSDRKKKLLPVTPDLDTREYTSRRNVVVHINGYIDTLTSESLNTSFKLTNTSYLTESFSRSNWSFLFRRSLETCRALFFFGYSMYDLDIQRIIYANEDLKAKTIFIDRPGKTAEEIESSIQIDFGEVLPIGLDGFWQAYDTIKHDYIPQDTSSTLFCFEEIAISPAREEFRDSHVFDLLLKGESKIDFIWDTVNGGHGNPYYIVRDKQDVVLNLISGGTRNVVTTSDLANGKSLFLAGLTCKLIVKGYRAYWLKDEAERATEEIDRLASQPADTLIVIENYPRRLEEIKHVQLKRSENLILLLSAKSGQHETYQEDLLSILDPATTVDIDLNLLTSSELDSLDEVLTTYKLWGDRDAWPATKKRRFLEDDCSCQLSSVLLEIVRSPSVQTRFKALFAAFHDHAGLADVMVAASVVKMLGFNRPSEYIISELLDSNYLYSLEFKRNPLTSELLSLGGGSLIPRSSILAKHGLTSFSDSRLLVDRLIRIAQNAHERGVDSELFFGIYRDLVTFSTLQPMLPEKGRRDSLIRFYEALKNLRSAKNHPHFWLQYAIARLASDRPDDLGMAKLFLDTAYAHAQKRKNYHTRHLDNVKARYLIQHAITLSELPLAMSELAEGHALLIKQCRTEVSEAPFKTAKNYLSFYNAKREMLGATERKHIRAMASRILEHIPKLPEHIQTISAVRFCRSDLQSVINDVDAYND